MVRERRRTVTLVSACAHPDVIATIRTYCWGSNHEMRLIPEKDGRDGSGRPARRAGTIR